MYMYEDISVLCNQHTTTLKIAIHLMRLDQRQQWKPIFHTCIQRWRLRLIYYKTIKYKHSKAVKTTPMYYVSAILPWDLSSPSFSRPFNSFSKKSSANKWMGTMSSLFLYLYRLETQWKKMKYTNRIKATDRLL